MLRLPVLPLLLLTSCLVDVNGGIEDGQAGSTTKGGAGEGGTGATGLGGATGGQGGTAAAGGNGGEGGAPNGGGGMGGVGGMPVSCTALEFDGDDRAFVAGLGDHAPNITLHGSFVPTNLASAAADRNVLLVRPGQFQLSVRASGTSAEFALQSLAQTSCITYVTTGSLAPPAATFQFAAEIKSTELSIAIDGGAPTVVPLPTCTLPATATSNSFLFVGDWDASAGGAPSFATEQFTGSINLLKAGESQCINFDATLASPGVDPIPSESGCNLGLDLDDDPNDPTLLCQ